MSSTKIVIPARYGSSRLVGKPLLEICNKPIFWHVYQRCLEAGFSREDILLATDDNRIFTKATELSIPVNITSTDHESGTDRIFEVVNDNGWSAEDIVINVQGDEPLISPNLIKLVSKFARDREEFSISTAITSIKRYEDFINPNIVKAVIGENNSALYFTRSASPFHRDKPEDISMAHRHIGIYAYRVSALAKFCSYEKSPLEAYEKLEQLRALSHGMKIGVCYYDGEIYHGVDTMEDYLSIKNMMENI
ncbi:3-deoxy-manno-octulosonate cytidylyltransferase [Vibrio navarrensis]|uniref:3-deoxy-manno-octulosonate cytidylyltransferase n=1 Tax=Vibrio navarrensis TaxID=29495 RepID=UPI001869D070|nr:3-deoxy-manno-octulosonate cytidylyltransferase [Vibrio navarrensis]MBE4618699.1 3-deoxy-manno-octulosonate cytidylyltransferase [Vibrio navarrensis]